MRYRIFALAVLFALLFSHSVLAEQEADILSDSGILCLVNREKHLPKDYAPSERAKYIESFFANINWDVVNKRLK